MTFVSRAFFTTLFVASCLPLAVNAATKDKLEIKDAYVRAVPASSENTAAYLTIQNHDKKATTLVKAESKLAKAVELHQHLHENGVMKMVQVQSIEVPAEGSVKLEPMGYHIMMIGLTKEFAKAKSVSMKLTFSDGTDQTVIMPVQKN